MDKVELEKLISEGLSGYEIARHYGKGYTTIRYWLGKYGLGTKKICKCGNCGDINPEHFFCGKIHAMQKM